ncbi:hypothetical protein [Flavobacterium sp. W22_SRS_FP1]|uniref:hypothetical protein n=1 Tax=Flavobacterium sp. W22_SRS_FP1 TaxID=3240276 RepID=UPI003F907305
MKNEIYLILSICISFLGCSDDSTSTPKDPMPIITTTAYKLTLSTEPEFQVGANLELNYFNDITVGVLNYSATNIKLITSANTETVILEGSDLKNITSFTSILKPSVVDNHSDTNAIDYNYIGLGQILKAKDNKIYGLYHGEWHDGSILPGNVPGFYGSIGLCISTDGGTSFSKSTTAVIPNLYDKNYNNEYADGGYGEPSLTFNSDSTAVYSYFVDHNRTGKGVNICMVKFNVLSTGTPDFEHCYFLNESNNFTTSIIRPKQIVAGIMGSSDAIFPHVTYNKKAKKYFMVYTLNAYTDFFTSGQPELSGIYIRTSNDGINWNTAPTKLITDFAIAFNTTSSFTWHPTLIYSNNDQSEGYLLYSKSKLGIAKESHKMWARKFTVN